MANLKELQTKAERLWAEVLSTRREASKAEQEWKDALHKWYEEQVEAVEPPKPLA